MRCALIWSSSISEMPSTPKAEKMATIQAKMIKAVSACMSILSLEQV
jgi:hypothetical protein